MEDSSNVIPSVFRVALFDSIIPSSRTLRDEKIKVLEQVIEGKNQLIEAQRQLINDYKRMLDIPVKPERTLRVV